MLKGEIFGFLRLRCPSKVRCGESEDGMHQERMRDGEANKSIDSQRNGKLKVSEIEHHLPRHIFDPQR